MVRVLIIALCAGLTYTGCAKKPKEGVVVIVNKHEVTKPEVMQAAEMLHSSMVSAYPEKAVEGITSEVMAGAAQQLIANRLMIDEAKKLGIQPDPKAVDSSFELLQKRFPDKAAFVRELSAMGETDTSFKARIAEGLCLELLMTKLLAGIKPADSAECRAFYETNKDKYRGKARVRASQIMFPFKDSMPAEAQAKLHKQAEAVLEKIRGGKTFDECAKEFPGAGDIGWFAKGDLHPAIDSVIFPLKKGEVSTIISLEKGYLLLYKTDEEQESIQPFEAVEKRVKLVLEIKSRNTFIGNYIDSLVNKADIKYIDTTLAKKPNFSQSAELPDFVK